MCRFVRLILFCLLQCGSFSCGYMTNVFLRKVMTLDETCDVRCSNVFDHVCGVAEASGVRVIHKFQNICHLNRIRCRLRYILGALLLYFMTALIKLLDSTITFKKFRDVSQVPDKLCNIEKISGNGRRVFDFSIVGAHQACNHTCPTYCIDTYEPACAQIWKPNMKSYTYRPMINHCHIDLFSCALGVNVTIQPLGKCYKNPSGLLFMSQVAAMKSLKLLEDTP